jgi:hypothetical protein
MSTSIHTYIHTYVQGLIITCRVDCAEKCRTELYIFVCRHTEIPETMIQFSRICCLWTLLVICVIYREIKWYREATGHIGGVFCPPVAREWVAGFHSLPEGWPSWDLQWVFSVHTDGYVDIRFSIRGYHPIRCYMIWVVQKRSLKKARNSSLNRPAQGFPTFDTATP